MANKVADKGESIRHFPAGHPLPDWRNFGVMLRVLLGGNALAALLALAQVPDLAAWPARCLDLAALVEPLLLLGLALLAAARDGLWRLPRPLGQALVVALGGGLAGGLWTLARQFGLADGGPGRTILLAGAATALLLAYFEWRARAFSPALAEARLAALNARIRPHFLFNSLNAVLSLVRSQPQQAEAALEALADLFRAALRDPAERVALAAEIALARDYLALEALRIGERLQVDWQVGDGVEQALIPPLLLQPLLENAVYHGIEPRADGGTIRIAIARRGDELDIVIANPADGPATHAGGNHMALDNIRERLALYYDLEARLDIGSAAGHYEVKVTLPWRRCAS